MLIIHHQTPKVENLICMQQLIYTDNILKIGRAGKATNQATKHTHSQYTHTLFTNTINTRIVPRRSCLENLVHGSIRSTVTLEWFLYGSMYRA